MKFRIIVKWGAFITQAETPRFFGLFKRWEDTGHAFHDPSEAKKLISHWTRKLNDQ